MDGKEAFEQCKEATQRLIQSQKGEATIATNTGSTTEPLIIQMYGAQSDPYPVDWEPDISEDSSWLKKWYSPPNLEDLEEASPKMRTKQEIRELLTEILLYLSRMGDYPDILDEIYSIEIIGDSDSEDADERDAIEDKAAVQILRWVLGEI